MKKVIDFPAKSSGQEGGGDRYLERRLDRLHLKQRLGVERDHESQVFGQGRTLFHIENWRLGHALLKSTLNISGLKRRARRNAADIELRHHDVYLAQLPEAFDGFTILHLSDMHIDLSEHITDALIHRIQPLRYDICVLTGDYRAQTRGPYEKTISEMRRVRREIEGPIYGVLGNHDCIGMLQALEKMDIRMLLNEADIIERGGARIHIAGIDDPHYYRVDNLEKAAKHIPPDEISILLSHSPEVYKRAAHCDFDLMLCGHTHGGQICLPGGVFLTTNADCPRYMGRGAWEYHQMRGYTSVGCGSCIVDARLNCQPEVTLHHLRRG